MDYRYTARPSHSPESLQLPFNAEPAEGASDISSPTSPSGMTHPIYTSMRTPYDMIPFGNNSAPYYDPMAGKIPVEYIGSTTLDEHDRRRSKPNSSKDKENVSNMHLRRRAQNRASQRAFRERKERHLKSLEGKLHDLHSKHQNLLQSYHQRTEEVQQLNSRIQHLTAELDLLRSATDGTIDEILTPEKFDIVPYPMSSSGPQYYFDKEALKTNGDQGAYGSNYDGL
ncbi:hypothetical protein ACJ73_02650 [Blastomyces percursus]|uniref:Putative transcription factor kapC n=1 Tax=Blastomyces percursus TaxID=1658174 RepID=A0A1J9QBQ7_9EURO|nr:hypothetical protein ACJ73_02650 [Blastomyces percursus]